MLEMAVTQLKKAKAAGIDTIVDGTPINLGRDVRLIRKASQLSGVNVIVSSGFYHQQDQWLDWKSSEEIFGYLDYECTNGLEELPVLPGMMKAAIDMPGYHTLHSENAGCDWRCGSKAQDSGCSVIPFQN